MITETIKQMVPLRFKGILKSVLKPKEVEYQKSPAKKKVIIALAGFYQNLGDLALTYAQKRIIKETLPEYEVVYLPSGDTYSCLRSLQQLLGPEDIITINGGGNMDDLYSSLEDARRLIVSSFPNNPIISFPQTVAFSSSPRGQRELRKSVRVYNKHPNLKMFARELLSFEAMKANFPNAEVGISPDTVLSLEVADETAVRSGIMITIRDDQESRISRSERDEIESLAQARSTQVTIRDTVDISLDQCQPETYEYTLQSFWKEIGRHKLVITDRLHSMIFCVITKTPVVVLSNSNHKIEGTYRSWLRNHDFVRFVDTFDKDVLSVAIEAMWGLDPATIKSPDLDQHYEDLRVALRKAARSA